MNPIKYLTTLAVAGLIAASAGAAEKPTLKDLVQQETNIVENETKDVQKLLQAASTCDGMKLPELRFDADKISCHQCRPEKGKDYYCPDGTEYSCPDYLESGQEELISSPCSVYPDVTVHQYSLADINTVKVNRETMMVVLRSGTEHTYTFPTRGAAAAISAELQVLVEDYVSLNTQNKLLKEEKRK